MSLISRPERDVLLIAAHAPVTPQIRWSGEEQTLMPNGAMCTDRMTHLNSGPPNLKGVWQPQNLVGYNKNKVPEQRVSETSKSALLRAPMPLMAFVAHYGNSVLLACAEWPNN